MLDSLFVTPTLSAITEAIRSARAQDGELAVVGRARLAMSLAKKLSAARTDIAGVEERSLAGIVAVDASEADVAAWTRVVRDGGVIVFVDKGDAHEASRRALCAGLTQLEQRHAGRTVVTSGVVTHLL